MTNGILRPLFALAYVLIGLGAILSLLFMSGCAVVLLLHGWVSFYRWLG
jgi:hypothetical protein